MRTMTSCVRVLRQAVVIADLNNIEHGYVAIISPEISSEIYCLRLIFLEQCRPSHQQPLESLSRIFGIF